MNLFKKKKVTTRFCLVDIIDIHNKDHVIAEDVAMITEFVNNKGNSYEQTKIIFPSNWDTNINRFEVRISGGLF